MTQIPLRLLRNIQNPFAEGIVHDTPEEFRQWLSQNYDPDISNKSIDEIESRFRQVGIRFEHFVVPDKTLDPKGGHATDEQSSH